jgi:CubicO group peptidase (beta-lactamase class C family)
MSVDDSFRSHLRGSVPLMASSTLVWIILAIHAGLAFADDSTIEQRIQHIQNDLLPLVVVKGEPTQPRTLADRMEALHVPGVSIAVIRGGKLEWARGFGVMRVGGPPVTPDTLFQAASISKPITALAVLQLVQAGKLDLDVDVNQYLKTWKLPANEFTSQAKVTLRGLLNHSAGITVHGFEGYPAGDPVPTLVQVLNGEPPANSPAIRVDMVPRSRFRYSGGGYVIIQQVLTDVTDVPFPKIMHDMVLGPLGMEHSTYAQPLSPQLLAQAATPYQSNGYPVPGGPHVYPEQAAAGLWTTPSDLARYAIGVQQALAGSPKSVLSVATTRAMLTPGLNHQGLGPQIGGRTGDAYFTHPGSNDGFMCDLAAYNDGDGTVIMTNGDNGGELIRELLGTIAQEYTWPDFGPLQRTVAMVDPKVFDRYAAAYQSGNGPIVRFWREGKQIYSQIGSEPATEIFPMSQDEYFSKQDEGRWVFLSDTDGKVTAVTLYRDGEEEPPIRLGRILASGR